MIKGELFWGPLGWLLRKLGGIPVDRKKGSNVALSVIKEMKAQKVVHLALAPEGTRKPFFWVSVQLSLLAQSPY